MINKIKSILIFCLIACSAVTVQAATLAYWNFEEGSGQNLTDISGNTIQEFIRGTSASDWMDPEWTEGIKGDHALKFMKLAAPANGGVCSFINGYDPVLCSRALVATGSFTVEAFIKIDVMPADGYTDARYIVSLCDNSGTYASYWNYAIRLRTAGTDTFVEGLSRAKDGSWPTVTSTVALSTGVEYYVAFSYNADTMEAKIWVDNNTDTSTFAQQPISTDLTSPMFTIGARRPSSSYSAFFEGVIDDVRVSDTVLTTQEMLSYGCGSIGYDPMDFNQDCRVDMADLAEFAKMWGNCSIPYLEGCDQY
ncbi:hypothetical protein SMSP2_01339 [Limihaloglobus sulfuriphilus]|uniref:LamG-like jellyroll fold domain-containing protein n=2 Tax=Limihaloglobus sulfuriphilus TaxID=1851148 RepID=A0A1Q2ME53_9BACT|nr:hypothetical protein SMSP2_01339 [Limihaloglobus sulfuriphilus]